MKIDQYERELADSLEARYAGKAQPPPSNEETSMHGGRRGHQTDSEKIDEILKRVTRTETRVTADLVARGVATQAQKPTFHEGDGEVRAPSPHVSLKELLDAIPDDHPDPVHVYVGDDLWAVIDKAR